MLRSVDRTSLYSLCQMKPTRCTLLLSKFISTSLHVSSNYVPIIRRIYSIYATLVFFTLYGWLSGLLVGMRLQSYPSQQTRQPPSLIPNSRPDRHAVSSQPADQTATQSHPNQNTTQPPSLIPTNTPHSHPVSSQPTHQSPRLIPTSRPDSHPVASQPAHQTASHTE